MSNKLQLLVYTTLISYETKVKIVTTFCVHNSEKGYKTKTLVSSTKTLQFSARLHLYRVENYYTLYIFSLTTLALT